jgi:lactoylglutathione lyase
MQIEHIAIYFSDLEKAKDFFVKYFGATANNKYHNQTTGFKSYFLTFDGSSRLEIMTRPGLSDREKNQLECGYAHIAISVGAKETADAMTRILSNDGYKVVSNPRTTGDGCYESCIEGPEGNLIEITI